MIHIKSSYYNKKKNDAVWKTKRLKAFGLLAKFNLKKKMFFELLHESSGKVFW